MTSSETFNEYQQQRHDKAQAWREQGIDPYPTRSTRTHTSAAALQMMADAATEQSDPVTVAGRIIAIRVMGKAAFAKIEDGAGQLQLYFKRDTIGVESYQNFKKLLDMGDFIEATGPLFVTHTGETTVDVQAWTLLTKALNQPPDKWHGLVDTESRYRERYVDLMANREVREVFMRRAQITSATRNFMEAEGYLEMETPILQPLYGGASARPFVTHHHYAKRDLYLRIADELYLKRLLVGGFEKVYEIGKDFRNEGVSFKHNPEFTMLEAYQAYGDYHTMMDLVERCWSSVALKVFNTLEFSYGDHTINFATPWARVSMRHAIMERTAIDIYVATTLPLLQEAIADAKLKTAPKPTWGRQVDELFSETVEPHLIQPVCIIDYPRELSPLAKQVPGNPNIVERFEFFIGGQERGNAFTELNDPMEQLERFREQVAQSAAGDDEAHPLDNDFINALMYGMPPTGGIGWGMDRMIMLMTNQTSIREVILFPQLRADN